MSATSSFVADIFYNHNMKEQTKLKRKKKSKKIIVFLIVALFIFILCAVNVVSIKKLFKNTPLTLSVNDGETFVVEYGLGELPEVTACYRTSHFAKEDTYVDVEVSGAVDLSTIGTYAITYTASNDEETVSATHTYVVQDNTAPVITLEGGTVGYYSPGYTYIETGFTASDNYDGDLTSQVVRTESPTAITYSVKDSYGNETTVVRSLVCQDIVAPTITLNVGDKLIIAEGSTFVDPGFIAIDDVDGDISANVITSGTINSSIYGKQYLTYTVVDSSGNIYQAQRVVVVQEFTPPQLYLAGTCAFIRAGQPYVEPGYNAFDDIDGDVTADVMVTGVLDTNTVGIYPLTYTAVDSSLNVTTLTRTVYVYEPQSEDLRVNPTDKVVYLTFDDGPGPHTETLLDILDKYNVDVTFFVTNQNPNYQDLIGDAYFRGHTIGLHTYSHSFSKVYASESAYYTDLMNMSAIVEAQTGIAPTILRFPGGSSNTISRRYCKGIMTSLTQSVTYNGYRYCDWNVDSRDAGGATTSAEVAANVITGIQGKPSSIVLQHDTKLYSIEAVEEIICWGMLNGYTFLPMTDTTEMHHHDVLN